MRHISADDHATLVVEDRRVLQLVVESVQLSIDFQQYVGYCACVSAFPVHGDCFDALRQNATTQFGRLFDARIRIAAVRDDAKQNVAVFFFNVVQLAIQLAVIAPEQLFDKVFGVERHAIRAANAQNLGGFRRT